LMALSESGQSRRLGYVSVIKHTDGLQSQLRLRRRASSSPVRETSAVGPSPSDSTATSTSPTSMWRLTSLNLWP
jgi:hypothetical protein